MIVYGVAAQVSLIKLFIAGILPGLLLMALFSGYIGVWSLRNPRGYRQRVRCPGSPCWPACACCCRWWR